MEKYNQVIANNPKVEMIHVSLDRSNVEAAEWAKDERFPWLTVLPEDVESSRLLAYKNGNFVPDYSLVQADGKKIASGKRVFEKASKL